VPTYAHTMEDAKELVRRARTNAGVSVRALAQRAGVSPSTIVRIESGQVDPTFGMLRRILEAADLDVKITTRSRPAAQAAPPARRPRVELAELATAWKAAPYGDIPDWTRFRGALDQLAQHPDAVAVAIRKRPPPSGSAAIDALLAGIADKLADDAALPRPSWTKQAPTLDKEWATPGTPQMIESRRSSTPRQLRDRGLVLDEASLWRDPDTVGA
jgi:transcriptional regulator with XRE-family HTH domain